MPKKATIPPEAPPLELKQGRVYRAKKPKPVGNVFRCYFNDRAVIYLNPTQVQYDSPAVPNGRHYPMIPLEKFLAWAGRDVTDELLPGEWADYERPKKKSQE